MYATAIMFLVGTTLLLGSWYGLVVGLMLVVAIAVRALQEERTLRAELAGYDVYMAYRWSSERRSDARREQEKQYDGQIPETPGDAA